MERWLRVERVERWLRVLRLNHWAFALTIAGLLGLVEGSLSFATEVVRVVHIGMWAYWVVLFSLPVLALAASLGARRALAHLPIVIVVQDWFSLASQGGDPVTATWYAAVFGDNVLTQHWVYVPNFYFVGFAASVVLHVALDLQEVGNTDTDE